MIQKKSQYNIEYPIYYTDSLEWFIKHKIEKGPRLILLDADNMKVINLFSALYFIDDVEQKYVEFIEQVNC